MVVAIAPRSRPARVAAAASWEWRTFIDAGLVGTSAPAAEGVRPTGAYSETYLLSRHTPHVVVVRDERLHVRRLVRADDFALELWKSPLTITLPATGRALLPVWEALGVSPDYGGEEHYDFSDLLRHVVLCHSDLRAVTVTKLRGRITVAGCEAEHVRMLVRGRWLESLSFADPDPAVVRWRVRRLALELRPNMNYSRMLKCVLGLANGAPPFDWGLV